MATTTEPVTSLEAQHLELCGIDGVGTRLSRPIANNFVFMFVPRAVDTAAHLRDWGERTAGLNEADHRLRAVCRDLVGSMASDDAMRDRLACILTRWRSHVDRGANLVGCQEAIAFVEAARPIVALGRYLESNHPDVADAFVDVDPVVREVVRVNLYLPPALVSAFLGLLLRADAEEGLLGGVDRIEVAKRFPGSHPLRVAEFPTLMLYVGLSEHTDRARSGLALLCRWLRAALDALKIPPAPPHSLAEYALPWSRHANLMQGLRLYKRYLEALGLLDRVYDPATGHALATMTDASDLALREALQIVLADAGRDHAIR